MQTCSCQRATTNAECYGWTKQQFLGSFCSGKHVAPRCACGNQRQQDLFGIATVVQAMLA